MGSRTCSTTSVARRVAGGPMTGSTPHEAGPQRTDRQDERGRLVERRRRLRDATGPRERRAGRVVDGNPRAPLVFGERGVQRVEQLGGGGGVACRRANEVALAGDAGGDRREVVRARIEPLLDFRLDAGDRLGVGRAEPDTLERPAAEGDGQCRDEARADDPAERG